MLTIKQLVKIFEKYEKRLEFSGKVRYNEDVAKINLLEDNFDDFDWTDIELTPQDLPKWVQSELNSHIPSFVKDGYIVPRSVGTLMFLVKYHQVTSLDYIVIGVEKIEKD